MFFSFEGIDGSGKSTQARLLADALRQRGRTVVQVREPGGTDLGERIRSLLLDPNSEICDRAELLLFSAARSQLVESVIEPALAMGHVVLADRFYDSSSAYQGGGRRVAPLNWMNDLHHFSTHGRSPDRTYLIDVLPSVAASRRAVNEADRMERGGVEFYQRIRDSYLALASASRFVILDGTHDANRLHKMILADALGLVDGGDKPDAALR